jgi:bla regulator protein blaR1
MSKTGGAVGNRNGRMLSAVGLLSVAVPVLCALLWATPGSAQAQSPSASAAPKVVYEYEVVSIKPNKSGSPIPGGRPSDDGIDVTNFPLTFLVQGAFGVGNDRIIGLPSWVTTDRFDINAKMDPAVADALKKLSADDRKDVQQRMVQAIFVDRCKLTFHRETRELPTFTLVLGKNAPKFKESKPGDAPGEGFKVPDGKGGTGTLQVGEKGLMTFRGLPISFMVGILSQQLGRTVVDKTGLTGKYDFSWQFVPSAAQIRQFGGVPAESGPAGASSGIPSDPDGTDLFTAVAEQLGLKLESGKGPVEVIVIDHMEKPSDN